MSTNITKMNDSEIIDNILNKNARSGMLNDLPNKINITIEDLKNIDDEELSSIKNSDEVMAKKIIADLEFIKENILLCFSKDDLLNMRTKLNLSNFNILDRISPKDLIKIIITYPNLKEYIIQAKKINEEIENSFNLLLQLIEKEKQNKSTISNEYLNQIIQEMHIQISNIEINSLLRMELREKYLDDDFDFKY